MELLRTLSDTPGVSGFEERVQEIVRAELASACDEVWDDRLGNVIGRKRATVSPGDGPPLKVMLAAHVDEIGFMVKHVDKEGFLRFMPIGGFDPRTLIGQHVIVHGREEVKGIIAPQPNWILREGERDTVLPIRDLVIDVGRGKEEVDRTIAVGDPISLAQPFEMLNDEVVCGRNFDDRAGVYAMIEAVKRVRETQVDVYAVSTVQEEVGLRGVPTAAYAVAPDVAIALDGSLASDVPYAREEDRHCSLGGGTGIYVLDSRTISDRKLVRFLVQLAEEKGIAYQINLGGGTDASVIQRHRLGARVCTIGPPTRYMHSTAQLCHVADIERTIALLVAFLENAHRGGLD
ncbi:MAG: M42 family metallopeptidase [Anaerolineae bacterium]